MKLLLLTSLMALAAPLWARAQPSNSFINVGTIDAPPDLPPQVYATNFVNSGTINIQLGSTFDTIGGLLVETITVPPFDFSDVLSYTNSGTMTCDAGFQFDTAPSGLNGDNFPRHMAANFINKSRGLISVGSISNFTIAPTIGRLEAVGSAGLPLLEISATNTINQGVLNMGENGLLSVSGNSINLSSSVLNMEGSVAAGPFSVGGSCAPFPIINPGIFDQYWGIGRGTNVDGPTYPPPTTPTFNVTTVATGAALPLQTFFSVPNAQAFENTFIVIDNTNGIPDPSNRITQIVFAGNIDNSVSTTIRFQTDCPGDFPIPVIQWTAGATNPYTRSPLTNFLYLADFFGGSTNFKTSTNFNLTGGLIPTQAPVNYQFTETFPGYNSLAVGGPFIPADLDIGFGFTNSYSAYSVSLDPVTALPDQTIPSSTFSNTPGRIEITANSVLNLDHTILTGPNYVSLTATNHFSGSSGSQFLVPVTEINLSSTNGSLVFTNLVAPYIPLMSGTIDAWSGQWTNLVNGMTNRFHVLMVASFLSPTSTTTVVDFMLRSTNSAAPASSGNVVISDQLTIQGNLLINAKSLTISTNTAGASTPVGGINLLTTDALWPGNMPNLRYFTNFGILSTLNTDFLEQRQNLDFPSPNDAPIVAVVNHGTIANAATVIWANYFENSSASSFTTNGFLTSFTGALITSSGGDISIEANIGLLRNGEFEATNGDIDLIIDDLTISNQTMLAAGTLNLIVTNQVNPTTNGSGRLWTNTFEISDGFNLPILPAGGDLLGSVITSTAPGYNAQSTWAGLDLGCSPAGFTNNMALGHVIFDALTNSFGAVGSFQFTPVSASNAIYIDLISLADAATNNANNLYSSFAIDPGMKIYFGGALIGNVDISEKLNTANGGAFCWVSNWNYGLFSSTNLIYPSGTTYSFNRALVESCDISSNGSGIPNCKDPTPIPVSETLPLTVVLTNAPTLHALVQWTAPGGYINNLYTRTNLHSTNWILVTNFVQTPFMAPVSIPVPVNRGGSALYRVMVTPK
jgi:hypothetical protein